MSNRPVDQEVLSYLHLSITARITEPLTDQKHFYAHGEKMIGKLTTLDLKTKTTRSITYTQYKNIQKWSSSSSSNFTAGSTLTDKAHTAPYCNSVYITHTNSLNLTNLFQIFPINFLTVLENLSVEENEIIIRPIINNCLLSTLSHVSKNSCYAFKWFLIAQTRGRKLETRLVKSW